MSKTFKMDRFQFDFSDEWGPIEQWDAHPAYLNGIHRSPCAKAVDLIGYHSGVGCLYFIEVKDYRVHPRSKEAEHRQEIEQKVCATVAGLVGAHRCGQHPELCGPLMRALGGPGPMTVVYWVELPEDERLDDVTRQRRRKVGSSIRTQRGKGYLGWLGARYLETNKARQDASRLIPGLTVSHLGRPS